MCKGMKSKNNIFFIIPKINLQVIEGLLVKTNIMVSMVRIG